MRRNLYTAAVALAVVNDAKLIASVTLSLAGPSDTGICTHGRRVAPDIAGEYLLQHCYPPHHLLLGSSSEKKVWPLPSGP